MSDNCTVVTHGGKFHTDEIVATVILKKIFNGITIVRTRKITDEMLSDQSVIVVDVGGSFNPERNNYDHHQPGAPIRESGIPYSSAGLVWEEYGRLIVDDNERLWKKIDEKIELIDAADNGVGEKLGELSLQAIVNSFNTCWDEDSSLSDGLFMQASEIIEEILDRWIVKAEAALLAEAIVVGAIGFRTSDVLRLPGPMPWHETFFKEERPHRFVVFQAGSEDWRIQCIPPSMEESFKQRLPLPEAWAGLRGADLEKASGITGATFCHKGRFMAGARTEEAALAMVTVATWSAV